MVITVEMLINKDALFNSGRHKHKEGRSLMICQITKTRYFTLEETLTIVSETLIIIVLMSNNNDTIFTSGRHKHKE